jgi:hypothetical protein
VRPHRAAEVVRGHLERVVGVHVAGESQRRVRRTVVRLKERANVLQPGGADVLGRADRHPVVRVIGRVERRRCCHSRQPIRPVLVVLPPLVEHDLALVLELGFAQRWQQVTHAIGFHPQRELERVARHDLPVVRSIPVGRSIQLRARFLERLKISAVVMLRPLEHQVLEQVGEPRPAGLLVLRSDVIPDVHRHDRAAVVLVDQDVEPVVEPVPRVRNLHQARIGVRGIGPFL